MSEQRAPDASCFGERSGIGKVRARGAVESSLVAGCVEIGLRGEERGFVHSAGAKVPSGVEKGFKISKFEFAFERQPWGERVAEGGKDSGCFVIGEMELARAESVRAGVGAVGFDLCGGG